jgi:phosphodiesterase/alkaline phosphatase D-like protein
MEVTVGDGSYDPTTREGAAAVEFVTPGVTSPLEISQQVVNAFLNQSPHIHYAEAVSRGYLVLDVQSGKVQSDWYLLDGIAEDEGNELLDASWAVRDGEKKVIEMNMPESPIDEPPALAT